MGEKRERRHFELVHQAPIIQITVLTGSHVGGAGKAGGENLWTASASLLGYVDEHGTVVTEPGHLEWLATEEDRGGWIHDLKSHTQYVVRVRRRLPADPTSFAGTPFPVPDFSHTFALEEVIARDVHVPALDERVAQYLQPVVITTSIGTFELERSLGCFSGSIDWCGHKVSIQLDIDEEAEEGSETCESALASLETIIADAAAADSRWRHYAAEKLVALSNDWQEQAATDDAVVITTEAFIGRISLRELSVSTDGAANPYYDDGDLFWGHVILIDVKPDGELTDAYIAG